MSNVIKLDFKRKENKIIMDEIRNDVDQVRLIEVTDDMVWASLAQAAKEKVINNGVTLEEYMARFDTFRRIIEKAVNEI